VSCKRELVAFRRQASRRSKQGRELGEGGEGGREQRSDGKIDKRRGGGREEGKGAKAYLPAHVLAVADEVEGY